MQKYNTYSLEDSDRQRIDLHKNSEQRRSSGQCQLYLPTYYEKEMGGIEYDDSAALYLGAKFPKNRRN